MKSTEKLISENSEYFFHNTGDAAKRLYFYPVIAGRFTYLKGYSLFRERFDSFLVMLVEKGSLRVMDCHKEFTAYPGQVVLLNCYLPHGYSTDDGAEILWFHFDGALSHEFYKEIVSSKTNVITPKSTHLIREIMSEIYTNMKENSKNCSEGEYSVLIHRLLNELISSESVRFSEKNSGYKKVLSYINENFQKDITVDELSKIAGLTNYYFLRAFKKKVGKTPHQYIIDTRLSSAKYYLSSTDLSVGQIAEKVGFTDESAFCHSFRVKNGITPLTYRNGAEK